MKLLSIAGAVALATMAHTASAATVTFTDFVSTTDSTSPYPTPVITVDDEAEGVLTFSISTTGEPGKLSGLFFDVSDVLISAANILNPTFTILQFANNTGALKGGVNLNGGFPDGTTKQSFDFGFRFAQTNVAGTPLTFQISESLLSLSDLERVGLRFQSVGLSMSGSAKVIGVVDPNTPAPIPLPAAGGLLLASLLGLALFRKRSAAV